MPGRGVRIWRWKILAVMLLHLNISTHTNPPCRRNTQIFDSPRWKWPNPCLCNVHASSTTSPTSHISRNLYNNNTTSASCTNETTQEEKERKRETDWLILNWKTIAYERRERSGKALETFSYLLSFAEFWVWLDSPLAPLESHVPSFTWTSLCPTFFFSPSFSDLYFHWFGEVRRDVSLLSSKITKFLKTSYFKI